MKCALLRSKHCVNYMSHIGPLTRAVLVVEKQEGLLIGFQDAAIAWRDSHGGGSRLSDEQAKALEDATDEEIVAALLPAFDVI